MPCTYDHPSPESIFLRGTAQLLVYVRKALGKPVEPFVQKAADNEFTHEKGTVPLLCAAIKGMNKEQQEKIVYNARDPMSRKLADWWEDHQESDREKEEAHNAQKRKNALIESAKRKLSKEEREALGI